MDEAKVKAIQEWEPPKNVPQVLSRLKIHPVFHVSKLKPFHEDEEDAERGQSSRAATAVTTSFDKDIREIISHREIRRRGVPPYIEYFVRWKGLPDSESSWESEDHLWQFKQKIEEYKSKVEPRTAAT